MINEHLILDSLIEVKLSFTGNRFTKSLSTYSFEEYFQCSLFLNISSPNQIGICVGIFIIKCFLFMCKCFDSLPQGNCILKVGHSEQS